MELKTPAAVGLTLTAALLLVSCARENPKTTTTTTTVSTPENKVTREEVRTETREAADKALTLARQEKEAYQKQLEDKLAELHKQWEQMKAKADQAGENAKKELLDELETLRKKREAARAKLKDLKAASAEAWKDMKAGIDAAADDLQKAVEKARTRFQ